MLHWKLIDRRSCVLEEICSNKQFLGHFFFNFLLPHQHHSAYLRRGSDAGFGSPLSSRVHLLTAWSRLRVHRPGSVRCRCWGRGRPLRNPRGSLPLGKGLRPWHSSPETWRTPCHATGLWYDPWPLWRTTRARTLRKTPAGLPPLCRSSGFWEITEPTSIGCKFMFSWAWGLHLYFDKSEMLTFVIFNWSDRNV